MVFLYSRLAVAVGVRQALQFQANQYITSVMAGISLDYLSKVFAPARQFNQTIPLGCLEKGRCLRLVCRDVGVLKSLFEPENSVLHLSDEIAFNKHFAVCAFLPGGLDLMVSTSAWSADQAGDPDHAKRYTRHLLKGFLAALPDEGAGLLPSKRDALDTESALSLQMIQALRSAGTHQALIEVLDAIGAPFGENA